MSGTDDPDAKAAEYVLGTLTSAEADAVSRAMPTDPALAASVAGWERLLAPLMRLAVPEAPPPGLWAAIEARIAKPAPVRPAHTGMLLRWWAGGATAAALAMAGVLLFANAPAPPRLATAMVNDRTQASWTASADADGTLRLAAVTPAGGGAPPSLPAGRVLQLWALPLGATAPTSLAILTPGQTSVVLTNPAVRPTPGMLIELTLEPTGGSPLPRPSGPVQFIGRLPT